MYEANLSLNIRWNFKRVQLNSVDGLASPEVTVIKAVLPAGGNESNQYLKYPESKILITAVFWK
ncbi:hypothetical protein NECAME_11904 [Necator americanus]|uniref:Uncharacterized protein n=1 Tax=Necator americanus TaxID=51031 RepID=W2T4F3_NECAM|nr:hypothetical protein NECAME_11904 [Necator americanus]ETN76121.1 hypothetical protein NECAME_11904 [Necator americanus]